MEFIHKEPRFKHRKITLHKNMIFHDIDVQSYKLAETSVEGSTKDKIASDSEDRLDGAVLTQLMEAREAEIRKKLAFCLDPLTLVEIDNTTTLEPDYVFMFRLPVSFNDNELRVAVKLMHEYMVKATLMDWYTHIGTNFGGAYAVEVAQLESRITDIFRKPGFVNHPSVMYVKSYRSR